MDIERNTTEVELLAPAGSVETLKAVVEAGADAVYIGGTRFGARAYADNPEEDVLLSAIDYAHLRGAKVYLTVNTILTDREMAELYDYLNPYYQAGLDAVIVQDFGVLSFLRSHFPLLPVHISTQMTVTDAEAADLFDEGVTRIVPARELSLSEIADMKKKTGKELEIFVHGALCYCYSGQCLLSSLIGGRSGNRGRCAQPCRKMYRYEEGSETRKGYLLSPKDQCLLPKLHELLAIGVHSLKIEGRMKSTAYAAGVTAVYRKWIDRYYELGDRRYREYLKAHGEEMSADVETLADLYNRGGFSGGYVFDEKGPGMMAVNRPNHTGTPVGTANVRREGTKTVAIPSFTKPIGPGEVLELRTEDEKFVLGEWTTPKDMTGYRIFSVPVLWKREYGPVLAKLRVNIFRMRKEPLLNAITEQFEKNKKPVLLNGSFAAKTGEAMRLTLTGVQSGASVTVFGPAPDKAQKEGTSEETVREKLSRTGGSGYEMQSLAVSVADGIFLPASILNNLRREGIRAYETEVAAGHRRPAGIRPEETKETADARPNRTVISVMKAEQLRAIRDAKLDAEFYIDMEGEYEACLRELKEEKAFLLLPRTLKGVKRQKALERAEQLMLQCKLDGVVVRHPDQIPWVIRKGFRWEADRTLYCANTTAVEYLIGKGAAAVTLSEELRKSELPEHSDALLTVYGRSLAMVSEQCPRRTTGLCTGQGNGKEGVLYDGEGEAFPVIPVCRYCHSLLYHSRIFTLFPRWNEVLSCRAGGYRLDFTTENYEQTLSALRDYQTVRDGGSVSQSAETTRGSFVRGVE